MAIELRPYQEAARDAILREWASGHRKTLLVLPTGCHAIGERVMLAHGTITNVERVYPGTCLMGPNGTERTVLVRHEGESDLYRIIPDDGVEPFVVTGDHKLTLKRRSEKEAPLHKCEGDPADLVDVPVTEWLKWGPRR